MGGNDHLVAFIEQAELSREFQRGAAVHGGKAGSLGNALIVGELAFKLAHVVPLGQGIGIAHGLYHDGDFVFGVADGAAAEVDFDIHETPHCGVLRLKRGLASFVPGLGCRPKLADGGEALSPAADR